jgi:branched-chain amino acid transport system substrate-binding protein
MRAKIPQFLVGGSTVLDHNTDPYFFRTSPSDSQQGIAMAAYAEQKGYKRAALAFEQQPAAQTLKSPITSAFTKHGGQIITTVDITSAQSSYRSEIQKLYADKPDVIFTQVSAQTASVFFPEVKQLEGFGTPFIGTNVFDSSNFFQAVGAEIASSQIYAAQASATDGGGWAHFVDEYAKAYDTKQTANLANDIYDAVILAALAIEKSGQTTGPQVAAAVTEVSNPPGTVVTTYADALKALKAGQKINYDGAAGNDDFDKYHNVFGPYKILHFTSTGTVETIAEIPAAVLSNY